MQQLVAYVHCFVCIQLDKHTGSQLGACGTHPSCCAHIYQLHDALPVSSELGCSSHYSFWPPLPSIRKIICLAACQQDEMGKISCPGWKSAALIRESSHV